MRRTRVLLLALFVLTACFAGGVLFLKFKLESLRAMVQGEALARGMVLEAGEIKISGMRGLRIADFHAVFDAPAGRVVDVSAPEAYLFVDVFDLLYGKVTVDYLQVDGATIVVRREEDPAGAAGGPEARELAPGTGFRILGRGCTLFVHDVTPGQGLRVTALSLDISRLAGAADVTAKLSGDMRGAREKRLEITARFTSMSDFDFRMQSGTLARADIIDYFPRWSEVLRSGTVTPSVRVAGYPQGIFIVSLEAPFRDVAVAQQPAFLAPAAGRITALARYDRRGKVLSITAAKVESKQFAGRVDGQVSFSESRPVLDLRVTLEKTPVQAAFDYAFHDLLAAYGKASCTLQEPYEIAAVIRGPVDLPRFSINAGAASGVLSFHPEAPLVPNVDLHFSQLAFSWDSESARPAGTVNITNGTLVQAATGLRVQDVSGVLGVANGIVTLAPAHGVFSGNPLVGDFVYDMDTRSAKFSLSGVVAALEETPLGAAFPGGALAGKLSFSCVGNLSEDHYRFELAGITGGFASRWGWARAWGR